MFSILKYFYLNLDDQGYRLDIEDVYIFTNTLSKVSFLKVSKSKFSPKVSSFLRISENDTFQSVILESVKIESVRVDRHPHTRYV